MTEQAAAAILLEGLLVGPVEECCHTPPRKKRKKNYYQHLFFKYLRSYCTDTEKLIGKIGGKIVGLKIPTSTRYRYLHSVFQNLLFSENAVFRELIKESILMHAPA